MKAHPLAERCQQQSSHRPHIRVYNPKYVRSDSPLGHLLSSRSLCKSLTQDRRRGKGHHPRADLVLPEGGEPEENQLASVVLQCLWSYPATQRLRAAGCRKSCRVP